MGGHSGKAIAAATPLIYTMAGAFAVSSAQFRLIERTIAENGSVFVRGQEIRTARSLSLFGAIYNHGAVRDKWVFTLNSDVRVSQKGGIS